MKKILLLLLVPAIIAGCGKKYTCSHSIDYRHPQIAFIGFDKETVKNAVMIRYKPNSNFTLAIDSIAIDTTTITFEGDTTYRYALGYYQGFFDINEGADYKIKLGNPASEYLITNITSGPKSESATSRNECSTGSSVSRVTTFDLRLNGGNYTPVFKPYYYFIYLKH